MRYRPTMAGKPALDWSGKLPEALAALGFSRESKIQIDDDGRLSHEGEPVEHAGLARAMMAWLTRHPENGRWVLENGWDWCYVRVADVPWVARAVRLDREAGLVVALDDGTEEPLGDAQVDAEGRVRGTVKPGARGGPHPAKLSRHAQLSLVDHLEERAAGWVLCVGGREIALGSAGGA